MIGLCNRINEAGTQQQGERWRTVRPTTIERWLQRGLLPAPRRPGRGRGAGRDVVYTDEHVATALETWALVREYRSTDKALFVLLLRGRAIKQAHLRGALLGLLDATRDELAEPMRRGRQQLDILDAAIEAPRSEEPTLEDTFGAAQSILGRRLSESRLAQALNREATEPLYLHFSELAATVLYVFHGARDANPSVFAAAIDVPVTPLATRTFERTRYRHLKSLLETATPKDVRDAVTLWHSFEETVASFGDQLAPLLTTLQELSTGANEFDLGWTAMLTGLTLEADFQQQLTHIPADVVNMLCKE